MEPMTVEATLQIGYDCGLSSLEEAFSQVMRHYDCFFLIDNFAEEKAAYDEKFKAAGLTVTEDGKLHLLGISIVDAAKKIGYTLKELELPEDNSEVVEDVLFDDVGVFEEPV